MPVLGILSLLAQIGCAVHVVRTGRNYYWIYIVVFVPVVGMAAYFLAEILPDLMHSRTGRGAASGMARALNPGKALRDANARRGDHADDREQGAARRRIPRRRTD